MKTLPNNFIMQTVRQKGCIIWVGQRDQGGYGRYSIKNGQVPAHRFAYERLVGPIPEGMHLDHLCRNRPCVNVDHLEPVTPAENSSRARPFRMPRGLGRSPAPTRQNEIMAEMARHEITTQVLAGHSLVDVTPAHLSEILRGRKALTPRMAEAIKRAIDELAPVTDGGS